MSDRYDFSQKTKDVIALRAGYRCAHPDCDGRTTTGPAVDPTLYEINGRACHIYSASEHGPRGQSKLTPDQISSASNGIWMCGRHADHIDKNRGIEYPPHLLLSWKSRLEYTVSRENGGVISPFGWVDSLRFVDSSIFRLDQKLVFSKLNFITGNNGSGKSAICDYLRSLKNPLSLRRWMNINKNYSNKEGYEIIFRAPNLFNIYVEIYCEDIKYNFQENAFPINPIEYDVIYIENENRLYNSHFDFFKRNIDLDEVSVRSLTNYLNESNGICFKNGEWKHEEDESGDKHWQFYCSTNQSNLELNFDNLSSSERKRILMDFSIARAKISSIYRPVLFIVDGGGFSDDSLVPYLEFFSSPKAQFQTIITGFEPEDMSIWGGWQIFNLKRKDYNDRTTVEFL